MEPKNKQRRIAFRKANKPMPRRRHDIPVDNIDSRNPEFLGKFVSETGKILPRRLTGVSARLHRKITREVKRSRALLLMK